MRDFTTRFAATPYTLLGIGLLILGILAMNHVINNFWPFDVERIDLVRATALDNVDAPAILEASNVEILVVFLACVVVAVTGLILPLAYYLNKRFGSDVAAPGVLVVLRQAMWVGLWAAFCVWLRMNRSFGLAIALLVAVVFILFEVLLQVRSRAGRVAVGSG